MKLSRSRSSLARVTRSKVILDPDANVPSAFSVNEPFAPVAVSTASDGRLTPTSCSRTRIVAFDLSLTAHASVDVAAVATAVAVGVVDGVGVEVVVTGDADPPHAAARKLATAATAMRRADARFFTRDTPPCCVLR